MGARYDEIVHEQLLRGRSTGDPAIERQLHGIESQRVASPQTESDQVPRCTPSIHSVCDASDRPGVLSLTENSM